MGISIKEPVNLIIKAIKKRKHRVYFRAHKLTDRLPGFGDARFEILRISKEPGNRGSIPRGPVFDV